MINFTVYIEKIDYEKSIENLLPQIAAEFSAKKARGGLEQFIVRLGNDAVPVSKKLLGYMDDSLKDGLTVWMAESRQAQIVGTVNQHLNALFGESVMKIGAVTAEDRPGTKLALYVSRVDIDYAALMKSPAVSSALDQIGGNSGFLKGAAMFALQMASKASPEALEKQGIALLSSDRVKPKLLSALSGAFSRIGLTAELGDLSVRPGEGPAPKSSGDGSLPEALKSALMDAVIAFLKDKA